MDKDNHNQIYTKEFYSLINSSSKESALHIIPLIMSLFPSIRSVADIGCGTGAFLNIFRCFGVEITGFEFSDLPDNELLIPAENIRKVDLRSSLSIPEKFDLAICLEVGEHMDLDTSDTLITTLTALSNIILFSAAIPGQPGTNHINCQWPSWWAVKFNSFEYKPFDIIRPIFWQIPGVAEWYRQNMILFINTSMINDDDILADIKRLRRFTDFKCAPLIHPKWQKLVD